MEEGDLQKLIEYRDFLSSREEESWNLACAYRGGSAPMQTDYNGYRIAIKKLEELFPELNEKEVEK
jgi:hypothetical protein